jgi:hypothetical protein
MPLIPAFIPLITGNQIINGPDNVSFSQIFALVNNVNGGGLDNKNIGSAGINFSLFNGVGSPPAGNWTVTGNLSVGTTASTSSAANTALTNSLIAQGVLALGRAGGSAFLFLGGSTNSSFISYNSNGLNEMNFGAPVFAGYYNPNVATPTTVYGNLTPVLQSNGSDSIAAKVIRGVATSANNGALGTAVTFTSGFTSSSTYIVIGQTAEQSPGQTYGFSAWPVNGTQFNFVVLPQSAPFNNVSGVSVTWIAIGY